MTDAGLNEHAARAVMSFANRSTFPLLQRRGDVRELFGTGTLFEVGSFLLLVTASHFVDEMVAGRGEVAIPGSRNIRYVAPEYQVWRSEDNQPYDIALVDVTPHRDLFADYTALTPSQIYVGPGAVADHILVAGFPIDRSDLSASFLRHPHIFPTRHYTGDPNPPGVEGLVPFDEDHHILVEYPVRCYQLIDGHAIGGEAGSCRGVSGGPAWVRLPAHDGVVWNAENAVKLYGVQSSQVNTSRARFLRLTRASRVLRMFYDWKRELAPYLGPPFSTWDR